MSNNQFPLISRKNRLEAIEQGKLTYESGTICKNCNTKEKYVKNSSCVFCTKQKTLLRDSSIFKKYIESDKGKAWLKEFRKSDTYKNTQQRWLKKTGYSSFIQSKRRKQIIHSLQNLSEEDLNKIKEIYQKASIMRKQTGKMFHVDHILRLADGGHHSPNNLQILDVETHRAKTSNENKKGGVSDKGSFDN